MSGALENPSNPSGGFGTGLVTFDLDLFTMRTEVTFGGLTGTTTNSHIHCCDAFPANDIVATRTPTFLNFPAGVTSGSYDHTYDMTLAGSYNAAFLTENGGSISQAFETLLNAARAGNKAYWNIHSSFRSGGEIRGYLVPVPEPSALLLATIGLAGCGLRRRRNS
jgi:hypothetical protein